MFQAIRKTMCRWLNCCDGYQDCPTGILATRRHEWTRVREAHLEQHPVCEVCGGSVELNVHHIKPYHLFPELELQPINLITLCTSKKSGVNCHLWFGHLGDWKLYNPEVLRDVQRWKMKLLSARLQSYSK